MGKTNNLSIRNIAEIVPGAESISLSDDFVLTSFEASEATDHLLYYPSRFDGFACVYIVSGSLTVESNLKSFDLKEGNLFIYVPGNISRVSACNYPVRCVVVAASRSLVSELQFDFTKLYEESFSVLEEPCIGLDEEAREVGRRYHFLIKSLLESGLPDIKSAIKPLFSSIFTVLGLILRKRKESYTPDSATRSRSKRIFESFLKLVAEHHGEQRYLDFYADKLCLTPKYLSTVVKDVSGMSAPSWIDSFVILESKNLLKYSELGVKEISTRLNFQAPSVFCRFFKAQTGMTPTEYRNS